MSQQLPSIRISGSGKVTGGNYEGIHISGSGHVEGSCEANDVHVSGSVRFNGSVKVAGKLHCSGSCNIDGDVEAGEYQVSGTIKAAFLKGGKLHTSGSALTRGIDVKELHASGSALSETLIRAEKIHCSGKLEAKEGIEAEEARISGKIESKGLVNVNQLLIELSSRSSSYAEDIGGESIIVRPNPHTDWLTSIFGMGKPAFKAKTIEGSDVELFFTEADVVRGARVRINEGCHIKKVEYTESLYVDPKATVDEF